MDFCCRVTLLGLLLLTLQSCGSNATDPAPEPGVIMPLRIGNIWVYEVTVMNSACSAVDLFLDTVKIEREEVLQSEKWFVDDEGVVQTNRSGGRWIFSGLPQLVEKYPTAINESYMLNDSLTTIRVRGVAEITQVPYGTFSTYIYRWTRGNDVLADLYYAVNTGLIQAERYSRGTGGTYLSERRVLRSATIR